MTPQPGEPQPGEEDTPAPRAEAPRAEAPRAEAPRRRRRWISLRGKFFLFTLMIAVTSCVRARTAGLRPPGSPAYAYDEASVDLPGAERGVRLEGYFVRPRAEGKFPCAILLHGKRGYWRAYLRYARELAGRGIASLILDYYSGHWVDLEGLNVPFEHRKKQFELQNGDIAAVAGEFSRYPVCSRKGVGLVGFSLGADKAFRTAAASPGVKAVVAYYGPYDYVAFIRHRVNALILALAGEDALRWKSYLEKNSPLAMAGRVRANVLMFHGVEDRTIPVRQSVRMLTALRRRVSTPGPAARMKLYEGVGHNFALWRSSSAERADSLRLTVAFLRKNLASKTEP